MGNTAASGDRSKGPRWARWCAVLGVVLMVVSGAVLVTQQVLIARYAGAVRTGDLFGDEAAGSVPAGKVETVAIKPLEGPLNILLVGIDPRDSAEAPRSDSIIIVHVPEGLQSAYLFSIPRDTVVDIPAFPKAGFYGSREKINAAMAYGSLRPGKSPSAVQGFELLSKTVSAYTGIKRFDAGAILDFTGFKNIVDAMGGVTMTIDQRVTSEHLQPDGSPRTLAPNRQHYLGPQKVYEEGVQHLNGWQALDYVRQRYGLENGDYDRQRHQQQFLKAMVDRAFSADVVTNPIKLDRVLTAAGKSLIFNGRGYSVVDYAFSLKGLRPDSITMVRLRGSSIGAGSDYQGERLDAVSQQFFTAVQENQVATFLAEHPEMINSAD
jgi:polyisoprenyl-teichoic acid--peptidoglycan teichoic acid transferase